MAIEWSCEKKNASYKVVSAGNAVRLYRNDVLHSQWNPKSPLSGKLWDLFLLPTYASQNKISNVLVLGAGGGSVINLIHHFFPKANIKAIDLDEIHIHIAKKYFKVNVKRCELICADAEEWLFNYQGDKFDLIIDDLFGESNSIPFRSIKIKKHWFSLLLKNLNNQGMLALNFADKHEWNRNYKMWKASMSRFNIACATHKMCDNRIVHIARDDISLKKIKSVFAANNGNKYMKYINNGTFSYKLIKRRLK